MPASMFKRTNSQRAPCSPKDAKKGVVGCDGRTPGQIPVGDTQRVLRKISARSAPQLAEIPNLPAKARQPGRGGQHAVSYTHLRAHETSAHL
eukprot:8509971-Alexandrium_andersonii.AAC.1